MSSLYQIEKLDEKGAQGALHNKLLVLRLADSQSMPSYINDFVKILDQLEAVGVTVNYFPVCLKILKLLLLRKGAVAAGTHTFVWSI